MRKMIAVLLAVFATQALAQAWTPATEVPTQIHNLDVDGRVKVSTMGANPCAASNATVTSVFGSTSGTAATQVIALSGTTKIYICSMQVVGVSGTTPTFSLVYGTGSNCGTGQATFLGSWTTAANTLYNFSGGVGVVPAGQALCYLQSGTTPVNRYLITYVQQ